MGRKRRDDAAEARAGRAYSRRNVLEGVRMLHRPPVAFLLEPEELVLLGVAVQANRPAVLLPGREVTVRDQDGNVVWQERGPDWEMSLRTYAEFLQTNPVPLTPRQRAKVVRRGR